MKQKILSLAVGILASMFLLTACGGGGSNDAATKVAMGDPNLIQNSSLSPSIEIYGFGESGFVSATKTVVIRGSSYSPSGGIVTLTPNLNSKDLDTATLSSNGYYAISIDLEVGDNTLMLTAKDKNGLTESRKVILSYSPNSSISEDFYLDTKSIAEGETKTITAKISFSEIISIKSVEIFSYPDNLSLGSMTDNGVLPDEIKADGLFTGKFGFSTNGSASKCFRAKITNISNASYSSGVACVRSFKLQTNETINYSTNIEKAISYLIDKQSTNLNDAEKAKNIVATIKANSNFNTSFKSLTYDTSGAIYWITKDGVSGSYFPKNRRGLKSLSNATPIGINTALYVSPHESEFGSPYSSIFSNIITSDTVDNKSPSLDIKSKSVFDSISNTGIIHLSTHGGQVPVIIDGKTKILTALSSAEKFSVLTKIVCSTEVNNLNSWLTGGGLVPGCEDFSSYKYGISVGEFYPNSVGILVTSLYFDNRFSKNAFANSMIYADACTTSGESDRINNDLRDVFFRKGAIGYIGYVNSVSNQYAVNFSKDIYLSLFTKNKSLDESFAEAKKNIGVDDTTYKKKGDTVAYPVLHFYDAKGVQDVSLPDLTLKNGNFESSSNALSPWLVNGDARVVSTLGQFSPTEGKSMGILSTGLGYTTSSGAISQKALVQNTNSTLKFSWNYMSEEFKQYCGSSYQDYFKVTACKKDGTCDTILNKKVDDFCSSVVQSNVVLNNGKPAVWATGWQNQTIDISAYRGKAITFKFEASDIGDSAYDTAVLLDGIKID
jgi:hypothetical protein